MSTQNGSHWKFLGSKILIHTLEFKLWHFEVFPYVCIGSHGFGMFVYKKITVRGGTLTILYQTLCIYCYLDACLHCICIQLNYVVLSGQLRADINVTTSTY